MNLLILRCFLTTTLILLLLSTQAIAGDDSCYPDLESCTDSTLQQGLDASLSSLKLQKAVDRQQLCVSLVDVTDPNHPRLAQVNGDQMMYAASLPKIAILLGAFERMANGELNHDQKLDNTLVRMIRNSSNRAATEVLNMVGKEYLAELLQSPRYRLYDAKQSGGLWVGKEYSKSPAWKRDPLANLSHGATALQVARFYYLLETGQLVSPEMSREMKSILGEPAIAHKFVKGLQKATPEAKIYRKSGTWRTYHADSALIEHDGRRYIAVALANHPSAGVWLKDLIVALDDLICHS